MILDGNENTVVVIQIIFVEIVRFNEVGEEHAYLEGEGDRTLRYWRKVHEEFFTKELEMVDQSFHEKMPVYVSGLRLFIKKKVKKLIIWSVPPYIFISFNKSN